MILLTLSAVAYTIVMYRLLTSVGVVDANDDNF